MEDYKKKYEDLITSLKKAKDDEMVRDDRFCVVIDNIVPKLKESEDERIRKELIHFFKNHMDSVYEEISDNNVVIAWLEKQGEQKPTWSEEDETALQDTLWCIEQARKQAKDENDMGTCWFAERWLKSLKERVQSQPKQEWSEEDEQHLQNAIKCTFGDGYLSTTDWLKSLKDRMKGEINHDRQTTY